VQYIVNAPLHSEEDVQYIVYAIFPNADSSPSPDLMSFIAAAVDRILEYTAG